MTRKPTDWRARLARARPPHKVVLHTDFAGVKAGTTMLIAAPEVIARWIAAIPPGETRTISRLRNELARMHGAQATCPVTTAIYLRVVAQVALEDLAQGVALERVVPFWRVIEPGSPVARKLDIDPQRLIDLRAAEGIA
jgi:hypothetical protein